MDQSQRIGIKPEFRLHNPVLVGDLKVLKKAAQYMVEKLIMWWDADMC